MSRPKIILHHLANFTLLAWFITTPLFILIRVEKMEYKLEIIEKEHTRVGQIIGKEYNDGRYTLVVSGYNKFLVSKDQYNKLQIGDYIPEYMKEGK